MEGVVVGVVVGVAGEGGAGDGFEGVGGEEGVSASYMLSLLLLACVS